MWASTNGISWIWVAGPSDGEEHYYNIDTFTPTGEGSHCQDSSYRQYRAGGYQNGVILSEVWMSVDGQKWSLQTADAEFQPVYLANMVGDMNGYIYIAGGIIDLFGARDPRRSTGDVWMSRNQGKTWVQQFYGRNPDTNMPQGPGERAVSILLNAQTNTLIWLTGVNSGLGLNDPAESYQKDVWVSTNMGKNFSPVNLQTPFGRRDDSNAEITDAGLIVLAGGYAGTGEGLETRGEVYNDIWVSANGGYTWGLCVQNAEWEDRRYQMTLLDGEGYMWVMGGLSGEGGGILDDMWKSLWTFNDVAKTAAQCRISVPSCGAGLKCLPNTGNTLVASDGSGVYCDSCPYTFSGQTAAQTVVVAFLVVFIILFIITVLALIYTYHKLRSAGAPSPIPLPATAQRWWNKSTTGGAIGGTSDAGNTANGDGLYQPLRIRDQV